MLVLLPLFVLGYFVGGIIAITLATMIQGNAPVWDVPTFFFYPIFWIWVLMWPLVIFGILTGGIIIGR